MKYIIKNCPCYEHGFCTSPRIKVRACFQCTDCIMKQIFERCKRVRECTSDICTNPYEYATYCEARGTLQLLDIQEIE